MLREDLLNDAGALLPAEARPTRRTALKALGAGYAAAAGAAMAQTAIKTPADGLTVGEITYDVGGFKVPAYRAAPAGRTGLPVVLVVHEVFGVHEYIADTARRFARAGYLAIAPELFARQGDPGSYGELAKLMAEVVAKTPDEQALADLDGALKWAGANGGDVTRAAITGFCWGGRITWLYAAHAPVKAGVAWYGRLAGESTAATPKHPLDVAAALKGPVLGLYGGADSGIPLNTVDRMKGALAAGSPAAKGSQFVVYPDTPHAFHADYRPSFRQGPAEDGWKRALEWLRAHGVA
ncbi:dienelactone hydrolase family protein [Ramlibacter humi]|uniref:Carboxymethylenebutenolidase n=1 Tax=Ramlibacter humi TaxID=2530451 RepID=A0A4Z0CBI0_9BURK|nr:dienelactone hydrolase family protein [Ramlibacter humi]TFZ07778.1 carboxymethylenebutenolidase [Ramlibacter humi]